MGKQETSSEGRWASKFPYLGTGPVPVEPCVSADFYAREIEKVYRRTWLKVARVEELPEPGCYKLKQLRFANTAVLLMHGDDGVIRGFHNTCSHRGNTVVVPQGEETFGKGKLLMCRFHAWSYDNQGRLANVPEEDSFYSCFNRKDNGLTPIHTDVWEGFVFINLAEEPEQSLVDFLGEMGVHFSGYPYQELTHNFSYYTYLNCNWKIGVDAFAEAYHVKTIHAGSFPGVFESGLANVQLYGPHRTCAICFLPGAEPPPIAKLAQSRARGSLVTAVETKMIPSTINPDRREDFSFELSVFFPNFLLHVAEGIWFTHQFWPIAHNKTLWEGKYYVQEPTNHSERWALEHAMVLQRNAWLEDTATMEGTHFSLQSGAKSHMNLQDEEILVRHGYWALDQYMNR